MDLQQMALLVEKYRGIPYQWGGRDFKGLDCLGLIHLLYKDCGIDVPDGDGRDYFPNWSKADPERYLRGLLAVGETAPLDALQPLDLVYFRLGKNITHGGVMVDGHNFIHVLQNTRVHVSPLNFIWRKRLAGARRLIDHPG